MQSETLRSNLGRQILAWYDTHHREMAWRVTPSEYANGQRPDPYRVWLSEVMLQQTTVATVGRYFAAFTTRWPTVMALARASQEDVLAAWAGLGYYARARNLHRCAIVVAAAGGRFPQTEVELKALPGIGSYTASAIVAIAFDQVATVVDGNVVRVMARLHAETAPLPWVKARLRDHAAALTPMLRPGDFAQAVMDLGATVCTPRRPACAGCPWSGTCRGRALGIAETLPVRAPKQVKPVRQGTTYLALDEAGRILTERRPERGLLGGMLALPSTEWTVTAPPATPPFEAGWHPAGEVRHVFTHFHLRLAVQWIRVENLPEKCPNAADAMTAMPTVFAKAVRMGLTASRERAC